MNQALTPGSLRAERGKKPVLGEIWPPTTEEMRTPYGVYMYVANVLKRRWKEQEAYIATESEAAYFYAKDIIGGRWPEGEPAIAQDPAWGCMYAQRTLRKRWPEAEPAILRSITYAEMYAVRVVRTRWPACEPVIEQWQSVLQTYLANLSSTDPEGYASYLMERGDWRPS